MCFSYQQKFVLLQGLRGAGTNIQEGTQFLKESMKRGLVLHISVPTDSHSTDCAPKIPVQVAELLLAFDAIFATPVGLPPIRGHEHQINTKEGVQAICQRPYRYPYYQKNEIKKIVKELLFVGSIKNSCSPFASHVLLVRKDDGS